MHAVVLTFALGVVLPLSRKELSKPAPLPTGNITKLAPGSVCSGKVTNRLCGSCNAPREEAKWFGTCTHGRVNCSYDTLGVHHHGAVFEANLLESQCPCGGGARCTPCTIRFASEFVVDVPLRCNATEGAWQCSSGQYRAGFYTEDCGETACMASIDSEFNLYNASVCVNGSYVCEYDPETNLTLNGCLEPEPIVFPTPAPPTFAPCSVDCLNGACAYSPEGDSCWCLPGYNGKSCSVAECTVDFRGFCGEHGSCNASSHACRCDVGYYGDRCDVEGGAELFVEDGYDCVWSEALPPASEAACKAEAVRGNQVGYAAGRCILPSDTWRSNGTQPCRLFGTSPWWFQEWEGMTPMPSGVPTTSVPTAGPTKVPLPSTVPVTEEEVVVGVTKVPMVSGSPVNSTEVPKSVPERSEAPIRHQDWVTFSPRVLPAAAGGNVVGLVWLGVLLCVLA